MIPRSILVLPRLFLGVIFCVAVYKKLLAPGQFSSVLAGFLSQTLPNAHPLYAAFARAVVLPNLSVFAILVMAGELFVGIAMLAGIATRLASIVAICLLLNYMLAKGMTLWSPASNDAVDIVLSIVVGLGAAGRTLGVDRILNRRFPRVPLW